MKAGLPSLHSFSVNEQQDKLKGGYSFGALPIDTERVAMAVWATGWTGETGARRYE